MNLLLARGASAVVAVAGAGAGSAGAATESAVDQYNYKYAPGQKHT